MNTVVKVLQLIMAAPAILALILLLGLGLVAIGLQMYPPRVRDPIIDRFLALVRKVFTLGGKVIW